MCFHVTHTSVLEWPGSPCEGILDCLERASNSCPRYTGPPTRLVTQAGSMWTPGRFASDELWLQGTR